MQTLSRLLQALRCAAPDLEHAAGLQCKLSANSTMQLVNPSLSTIRVQDVTVCTFSGGPGVQVSASIAACLHGCRYTAASVRTWQPC